MVWVVPGRVTHHNSTSQPSPRGFLTGVGTASPCSHQKTLQERFTRRHFDTRAFLTALGLAQDLFQCLLHWGSQQTTPLSCPLFFSCISPGLFGIKKKECYPKTRNPCTRKPKCFYSLCSGLVVPPALFLHVLLANLFSQTITQQLFIFPTQGWKTFRDTLIRKKIKFPGTRQKGVF